MRLHVCALLLSKGCTRLNAQNLYLVEKPLQLKSFPIHGTFAITSGPCRGGEEKKKINLDTFVKKIKSTVCLLLFSIENGNVIRLFVQILFSRFIFLASVTNEWRCNELKFHSSTGASRSFFTSRST